MDDIRRHSYLVTGGGGFIGSNIVSTLLRENARMVRVLDNFSTGRRQNLQDFLPHIELVEGDIRDPAVTRRAIVGVDFVLHQAAIPSVPRSIAEPVLTTDVNVTGTVNVLEAAAKAGVRRVVIASSSSIYGGSAALPTTEDLPISPLSPYAASKAAAEQFCLSFHRSFNLDSVCLRYFNVFGPRQDPNSQYAAVIPRFIAALATESPLPIYGDGEQTRDFTFVGNVVQANLRACTEGRGDAPVVNIGCGTRISLLDLGKTLARLMHRPFMAEHSPEREGDVKHSCADISRARALLGYEPHYSFEEGLKLTIDHFHKPGDQVQSTEYAIV